MEYSLHTLLILSFLLVIVLSQDTLLQDTKISQKRSSHKHLIQLSSYRPGQVFATITSVAANLSCLEERLGSRIRASERRIKHRFHRKFRLLNQTAHITHLQDIADFYIEEIQVERLKNKGQDDLIQHLKSMNSHQQKELNQMNQTVDKMSGEVEKLTKLVEQLMQRSAAIAHSEHSEQSEIEPETDHDNQAEENNHIEESTQKVPFIPLFPIDCQYVYKNGGMSYPGFYYIMIQPVLTEDPFSACCKITNSSGWTLLQRRQDGSVDFYQNWQAYKEGFGNLQGEFWMGNEHIHQLTSRGNYKLRIELRDWDNNDFWAEYDHFRVDSEAEKYRLHAHGYSGSAGDSLTMYGHSHNGQPFSTYDSDEDQRIFNNCAEDYHGAWWFHSCFESHLNGVHYTKGLPSNYFVRNGILWNTVQRHYSLQSASLMVKPNPDYREDDEQANGI